MNCFDDFLLQFRCPKAQYVVMSLVQILKISYGPCQATNISLWSSDHDKAVETFRHGIGAYNNESLHLPMTTDRSAECASRRRKF